MRFCLLTRFHSHNGGSSFVRRLQAEAEKQNHVFDLIDPAEITLAFNGPSAFPVYWKGQPLPYYDLIHYAVRWDDDFTWEILETLSTWNRNVLPPKRVPLGDSVTMARLMARRGIATPRSWVLATAEQLPLILPEIQFPCIIRVRKGLSGRQVHFANHAAEAIHIAQGINKVGQNFLIQEVPIPMGQDVRAFVIGNNIIAAVERTAKPGLARPIEEGNPRVVPTTLTEDEKSLIINTMQVYSAPYAAVSILRRHNASSLMLELSRAPALAEAEQVSGINIAAEIIRFLASSVRGHELPSLAGASPSS